MALCSVILPRDITKMRQYVSICEDLSPVPALYRNWCRKTDDTEKFKKKIVKGIDITSFNSFIKASKSKKRPCPFVMNR